MHLNGTDMVSRFLRLLELSPFVQYSTGWRQTGPTISFTSAWRLNGFSHAAQDDVCREIMANQLGTKEVEQVVQIRNRSGRPLSECVAEVVRMRREILKVHLIMGALTEPSIEKQLAGKTQAERDEIFGSVLAELFPMAPKMSGRLGDSKFTIVTNEEGQAIVSRLNGGSFEAAITQGLREKMGS